MFPGVIDVFSSQQGEKDHTVFLVFPNSGSITNTERVAQMEQRLRANPALVKQDPRGIVDVIASLARISPVDFRKPSPTSGTRR